MLGVLKDFATRYLQDGKTQIPKGYLQVLTSAVNQISEDYKRKSEQLLIVSEKATNVIEDSSLGLQEQEKERKKLAKIIESFEESLNQVSVPTRSSSMAFFPTVSYLKERDIVRIKRYWKNSISFLICLWVL